MIVHRCDRCEKDFKHSTDLVPVSLGRVDHDERDQTLNRNDVRLPVDQNICKDCCIRVLRALLPKFLNDEDVKLIRTFIKNRKPDQDDYVVEEAFDRVVELAR